MLRAFITVAGVITFASFAEAQTFDRARFRQAIELPALSPKFGVNLKLGERDPKGNLIDPAQKLAELQKKLSGGPDDAQVYLDMRDVYLSMTPTETMKAEELTRRAEELARKAEAALRPHMQTTDPKQAYLLTLYGTCTEILVLNSSADCEKWARRAVTIGPQDWRTWAFLARTRHQQMPAILNGGSDKDLPKEGRTQRVISSLFQGFYPAEHVDAAEKALDEIAGYHDKAKQLAPNEPRRQELRYSFRLAEVVLRNGIAEARRKPQPHPLMNLERIILDELEATARLHPEHLVWQTQLAQQLIVLGWGQNKDKNVKEFRAARPEDLQAIREALGRIEKLAHGAAPETAVVCHTVLASIHMSMNEDAAAEKHVRRILELDPKHQGAFEQLQERLFETNRKAELLPLAVAFAEKAASARGYYVLARTLAANERFDQAEKACFAGLKADATDPHCLLGSTCLLMRKSDSPEMLRDTAEVLKLARDAITPSSGADLFDELEYVSAIHQALNGEPDFARLKLEKQQRDHPENARYARLLAVLGR